MLIVLQQHRFVSRSVTNRLKNICKHFILIYGKYFKLLSYLLCSTRVRQNLHEIKKKILDRMRQFFNNKDLIELARRFFDAKPCLVPCLVILANCFFVIRSSFIHNSSKAHLTQETINTFNASYNVNAIMLRMLKACSILFFL